MRKPSGKINIKLELFSLLQIQKEWVFFSGELIQESICSKYLYSQTQFENSLVTDFKINKRQLKIDGIKVFDVQR